MKKSYVENIENLVVFVKRKIEWFRHLEKGVYRNESQYEIIIYDPITN